MTVCHKCQKPGKNKLTDKIYCNGCFCKLVEQRIRKHLRIYNLKKDVKLKIDEPACLKTIEKILKLPFKQVKSKPDFTVLAWTMDDENESFLTSIFLSKRKKTVKKEAKTKQSKEIKLFYLLSRSEINRYFAIKKIKCKISSSKLGKDLDSVEKNHPGTKSAILKTKEKLSCVLHR